MAQSHLLALRSTCTRLAVGATVVRDKRIIAGGYNGSITGGTHCIDEGCYVIDHHCVRTIHAEMNAVIQCAKFGVPTQGSEIYVTHFPCLQCCKGIIQSGIQSVYYSKDYKNHPYAIELFKQSGVTVAQVKLENMIIDTKNKEKVQLISTLIEKLSKAGVSENEIIELQNQANTIFTTYN